MNEKQTFKSLLGLCQEDLALILKVGRSQFNKYEQGTRNLPKAALELLAEIVEYVYSAPDKAKPVGMEHQQAQKQQAVQRMLEDNEVQQSSIAQKIIRVEEKFHAKMKALQILDFLSLRVDSEESDDAAILRTIARKTTKSLKDEGLALLFKLKHRMEMLQLEKILLDAEARKFRLAYANSGSR